MEPEIETTIALAKTMFQEALKTLKRIFWSLPHRITGKKYFGLYLRWLGWLGEGNFLVQILCGGR
jgi:hypothetical protein